VTWYVLEKGYFGRENGGHFWREKKDYG